MKKSGFYIVLMIMLLQCPAAQGQTYFKFLVKFSDKKQNIYSLERPGDFLSRRALERRNRHGIPLTEQDLPVSTAYLDSLEDSDLKVLYSSKWLNAAVIRTSDSSLAATLPDRPYITGTEYLYRSDFRLKSERTGFNPANKFSRLRKSDPINRYAGEEPSRPANYLFSGHQFEMLQGQALHEDGYMGRGMVIAVVDAGFASANRNPGLDSLFSSGRILGIRDFVQSDTGFFSSNQNLHGTHVLSILAGMVPGRYQGTAPGASYWLIQTEDPASEFRIEEVNLLAGMELADSAGADVINISLGYSTGFTDPIHNYRYTDMEGKSALASRAAQIAASKGMVIVSSAGNQGSDGNPWGFISAPADGDSVLTIGAVDSSRVRADFSSRGPTADGRIKPDVVAQGRLAWYLDYQGNPRQGDGTSFSAPLVSGLAACLWQRNPEFSNMELIDAIRQSASRKDMPDNLLGYGIPNFGLAGHILTAADSEELLSPSRLEIYPNPAYGQIRVKLAENAGNPVHYRIFGTDGRIWSQGVDRLSTDGCLDIPLSGLPHGSYILHIQDRDAIHRGWFIKSR